MYLVALYMAVSSTMMETAAETLKSPADVLDRDSPLVFISPDIPHRRACAHLKKGRRLTARHARRHFPRQTNTQVFRYSHDAPAKAAIESVRQDHDNKILIHSTSETL